MDRRFGASTTLNTQGFSLLISSGVDIENPEYPPHHERGKQAEKEGKYWVDNAVKTRKQEQYRPKAIEICHTPPNYDQGSAGVEKWN